jgi:circadian clock protein KaiB
MKKKSKTSGKMNAKPDSNMNGKQAMESPPEFQLRLYVAGQTPKSLAALANLKRICADYVDGAYQLEVIDLIKHPQLAHGDQILAIPTLVRNLPVPIRKIIGDLSNVDRVLVGLDLRAPSEDSGKKSTSASRTMGAKV